VKKAFLFTGALFLACSIQAQDIFKKHGFDKETLTLSKGRYEEVFTNKEIVQIGSVLLNTKTNKVVKFLDEETEGVSFKAEYSSRWLSPDPLAEKYPQLSPYVFCANNPVRYTDPTGKWIVGTDGKPVTYDQEKGWSLNASADVQKLGNAMMLTPEGTKVFNDMSGTKYSIAINYKEGFNSENHDKLGETKIDHTGDKINSVEINLFDGKIQEDVTEYQQANQSGYKLQDPTAKQQLLSEQTPTMTERIGQVGAHEGTHATDPNAMYHKVGVANAEQTANSVEMKVIRQTTEFNRPIPIVIKPLKMP